MLGCLASRRLKDENNSGGLLLGAGMPCVLENGINGVCMASVGDDEKRVRSPSVQRKDEQQLCEQRANKVFDQCDKKGCDPSNTDIEFVLRSWAGNNNTGRKRANKDPKGTVQSDTFGLVKALHLPDPVVSAITNEFLHIVTALNRWLSYQLGEEPFEWTTITVNHSWQSAPHRDSNNSGPSSAASFGKHSGGRLLYW